MKEDHEELHKYNTIVKGELTQCKQQLEKLYTSRENIDESMSIQRPTYDKTGLGYLFNMSAKKPEVNQIQKRKRNLLIRLNPFNLLKNPKKLDKRRNLRNWMTLRKWNLLR